jgi:hypothetical protein
MILIVLGAIGDFEALGYVVAASPSFHAVELAVDLTRMCF